MVAIIGDALTVLGSLESERFQTCITSPPYWGLRDYGHADQIGLERTPSLYVARIVDVFRSVRRVLRPDGTLWLNLGDSYASMGGGGGQGAAGVLAGRKAAASGQRVRRGGLSPDRPRKSLLGIPWRVAFALQDDGWILRSEIIWHKTNPTPESVRDRPSTAHERVFLFAKSDRYYYDDGAGRRPLSPKTHSTFGSRRRAKGEDRSGLVKASNLARDVPVRRPRLTAAGVVAGASMKTVWSMPSEAYEGAHFATMPSRLVSLCMMAGTRPGDEVLDPFLGSGTVGEVAERCGRRWLGIDIQPSYEPLIRRRTAQIGLPAAVSP